MTFKPGQSGNPGGRAVGSRNRKTLAVEAFTRLTCGVGAARRLDARRSGVARSSELLRDLQENTGAPPDRTRADCLYFPVNRGDEQHRSGRSAREGNPAACDALGG